MADNFTIPEEYEIAYRRILPYLAAPLHREQHIHETLLLYLKIGGERLARIAIDAFNVSQRQRDVEMLKLLRQEAMLSSGEADNGDGGDGGIDENGRDDDKKK